MKIKRYKNNIIVSSIGVSQKIRATEQEYVDEQFKLLNKKIEILEKNTKINRYNVEDSFMSILPITEQEYVDTEFKKTKKEISKNFNILEEKIEILQILNKQEYILIDPKTGFRKEKSNDWISPKDAREWARKEGYFYVQTFERNGELWVKDGKGK